MESAEPAAEPSPTPTATEPTPPTPETPTAAPPLDDPEPAVPDLLPEESPAPEAAVTRPKWGDLARVSRQEPAPPALAVASATPPPVETPKPASTTRKWRLFGSKSVETPKPVADNSLTASCEYIPKDRRLVDFRMVDLNGAPVTFHDLGADLVLLDFWGSWCGPCVNSIPKLVELQKQYPERTFKVVGIAYEQDDNLAERVQKARQATSQLGIPYTVLLGEADGKPCPLKEALHVQVYPTMILVDRQGNLVWRDQGVGPNTFSRLERILATRSEQQIARR
jgi:thiol-disulfide isomerase/thioredoxin